MLKTSLKYIQKYFFGAFILSLKIKNIIRFSKQIKRINDTQDVLNKDNKLVNARIATLENNIKQYRAEIVNLKNVLLKYEQKIGEMRCLEENVESIFKEIGNVKQFICKCQNQMMENLVSQEQCFKKINKNILFGDKSVTLKSTMGETLITLTEKTFTISNWCFICEDNSLLITYSGINILKLMNQNPVLSIYKSGETEHGMSLVTCCNFNIDHKEEEKLQILCENNTMPLHSQLN